MIRHIAAQEMRHLFLSPMAWTVLAVVEFILGYLFLSQVDTFARLQPQLAMMHNPPGVTQVIVAPLFATATIVLLLVVPLVSMRLVSEERRNRTLPLLFSAPVSMTEIVLGKYLGLLGFLGVMLALLVLMPLSLLLAGHLDFGAFAAALLGLALILAAFAAAGLYMSTLTSYPTVAAVSTFGLLLLLWIINWAGNNLNAHGSGGLFAYLSLQQHYQRLLSGLFDTSDVVYYLLFTLTFLVFSVRRLDADRLQH